MSSSNNNNKVFIHANSGNVSLADAVVPKWSVPKFEQDWMNLAGWLDMEMFARSKMEVQYWVGY